MLLTSFILTGVLLHGGQKLQVTDMKVGAGETAKVGDALVMNYTGKLTNGKVFDSTDKHPGGEPFTFVLGAGMVIKGWDQGLLGMKVGGKRHLIIPPDMGYGSRAMGEDIPANSTLVFDVELKEILRAKVVTNKAGHGPGAKFGDTVEANLLIKLTNGTVIEDTAKQKGPTPTIPVSGSAGLPSGFLQALLGLKAGEKRTVTIPPALGLGKRAAGKIPANSTLIIEIEASKVNGK